MRKQRVQMESRRSLLRPFIADDLDWLTDLVADREVNRFLWDDVESREKAGRIAEEIISLDLRRFQFGHWAIQDKNTGAFLGWTALGKLCSWSGPSDEIAVSYALRRASWGQGFATEAAGHLVCYAFEVTCLERVMAVVDARNTASKRVLEKIGMYLVISDSVDGRCRAQRFGGRSPDYARFDPGAGQRPGALRSNAENCAGRQAALEINLRGLRGSNRFAGRASAGRLFEGHDGKDLPAEPGIVPLTG
jgi:RimJ/RimL family protein N-acetyltransferase